LDQLEFSQDLFQSVSSVGKDFVAKLLQKDPTKRPTAAEALTHPWFFTESSSLLESVVWDGHHWSTPDSGNVANLLNASHLWPSERFSDRCLLKRGNSNLQQTSQNFITFTKKTPLQRVLLNAITMNMNLTEQSHIREASKIFDELDTNHDGVLSQSELKRGLQIVGVPDKEVTAVIEALDVEDSGYVTFSEFVTPLVVANKKAFEQHAMSVFRQIDSSQDGKLSAEELCEMILSSGAVDQDRTNVDELKDFIQESFIRELDTNQDGFVQCEELCNYVTG